jgi:protein-tyrosine phosphatase
VNPDLFWIPGPWRGRLAVAARPRGGDWLDEEAAGWRHAGLNVIISLLENEEAAQLELFREGDAAASNGVKFISFPIPDRGAPPSVRAALPLLKKIVDALEEGKNVAVHCRQGIGRSGLIAVGALMSSGIGAEKAIDIVSKARGLKIPETPAQLQWIHALSSENLVVTSS